MANQITDVSERLEKQAQALFAHGQLLSGVAVVMNERLKHQEQTLFAQRQLLVNQGELLSRMHADVKECLENQSQRLSLQGRLLSCILEVVDHGRLTDVDTEVDEGPDDKPRRVTLKE